MVCALLVCAPLSWSQVVFSESFESGAPGWTIENGVWEIGAPTSGPASAHGGTDVAGTVLDGHVPTSANARLISPEIVLPAASADQEIWIRFWQWYHTADWNDYGQVEIQEKLPDDTWSGWTVLSRGQTPYAGVWSLTGSEVSLYAGKTVRLGFRFISSASATEVGWYIDDVVVWHGTPDFSGVQDFEAGWGQWDTGADLWLTDMGGWGAGQITDPAGPSQAHSGTSALGTRLDAPPFLYMRHRIISPTAHLPEVTGGEEIWLRYWQWYHTADWDDFGWVQVQEKNPDGTWSAFATLSPQINPYAGEWSLSGVDLTAYAGKSVRIAFYYQTDAASTATGWYLDDVVLWHGTPDFNGVQDFEDGWDQWSTRADLWLTDKGGWGVGPVTEPSGPSQGHSGTSAMGTRLDDPSFLLMRHRIISPTRQLPAVVGDEEIWLRYWQWYHTADWNDFGYVQVQEKNPDGTWSVFTTLSPQIVPYAGQWSLSGVDLTAYAGKSIRIAFYFQSDGATAATGWYVDDVVIWHGTPEFTGVQDFEAGWDQWSTRADLWLTDKGGWGAGQVTDPNGPTQGHSGTSALGTRLDDSAFLTMRHRIISPTARLPEASGQEEIWLRYWQWYHTADWNDFGYVQIQEKNPDGTWTGWSTLSPQIVPYAEQWSLSGIDLTAYAGKSVRIAFYYQTDEATTATGWYVDDVLLWHGTPEFSGVQDFEAGWDQWETRSDLWMTRRGGWGVGPVTDPAGPAQGHSGTSAIGTRLDGPAFLLMRHRIVSPTANLPTLAAGEEIWLRFWQWYDTADYDDLGQVQIQERLPDGSWSGWTILSVSMTPYAQQWSLSGVDLTPYAGKSVRIGLYYQTDGVTTTGWYVDDVVIWQGTPDFSGVQDFETGWDQWETRADLWLTDRGTWGVGEITDPAGPASAHSGSSAMGTRLDGNAFLLMRNRIISPTAVLPALAPGEEIWLRFWQWYYTEDWSDLGYIQVKEQNPDGSWTGWVNVGGPIRPYGEAWGLSGVELTPYAGKSIRVAFYYQTNDVTTSGWYVDDVAIWQGTPAFETRDSFEKSSQSWENDPGIWVSDHGIWQTGPPVSGPTLAHGCSWVAGTVLDGNHPAETDSRLVSPTTTLPLAGPNLLRFWHWYSYGASDQGQFQISEKLTGDQWSVWTTLETVTGSSDWVQAVHDLSSYAGKTVRFGFLHVAGGAGEDVGWYIDDLTLDADWDGSDGDGTPGECDNCPGISNPDQLDRDFDAVGDLCDTCPDDPYNDIDADGLCADGDNCPRTANPLQVDTDGDGIGDACDRAIELDDPQIGEIVPGLAGEAETGSSVASAGDLNHDGIADFLTGAPSYQADGGPVEAGAAAVYLGSADQAARDTPDIIFEGVDAHDRTGVSVAGGFDFDGDGTSDLLLGAEQMDSTVDPAVPVSSGKVFLIFFDPADYPNLSNPAVTDTIDLSRVDNGQADEIRGIVFTGAELGDRAGFSLAGGGRVNAGVGDDLIIGAPGANPQGRDDAGIAYVIFDDPSLTTGGPVSLSRVASGAGDQVEGVVFQGEAPGDELGYAVTFPGDVVGTNGADDLGFGAPGNDALGIDAGSSYFIEGGILTREIAEVNETGTDKGTHPNSIDGSQIQGSQPGERLGESIAGGGDNLINGELDLLIGAPFFDLGASLDSGRVIQTASRLAHGIYTADQVGGPATDPLSIDGVIWIGEAAGDRLGSAVAGLGDVNKDGLDDVALGAPYADPQGVVDAGAVYIQPGYVPPTFHLGTTYLSEGFSGTKLIGTQAGERAGTAIAGTGDLNDDAEADLVIGAPGHDSLTQGADTGQVYIVLEVPCGTVDNDLDGFADCEDNCPAIANASQGDLDSDGVGNICDNCPDHANADQADPDGDEFGSTCDNCPDHANASQADQDLDGVGNACDSNPVFTVCAGGCDHLEIQDAVDSVTESGTRIMIGPRGMGSPDYGPVTVDATRGQVLHFVGDENLESGPVVVDGLAGAAFDLQSTVDQTPISITNMTLKGAVGVQSSVSTDLRDLVFADITDTALNLTGGEHRARRLSLDGTVSQGVDLAAPASLNLARSTFRDLTSTALGISGTAEVVNTLFAGAAEGIVVESAGVLILRHVTVADCAGVGITNYTGSVTLDHVISWGNLGGDLSGVDCVDLSWSLTGDASCAGSNQNLSANPLFVGSGDYHLSAGSPGLDHGPAPTTPGDPEIDLEGPRTRGPRYRDFTGNGIPDLDIGAYETENTALSPAEVWDLSWTSHDTLVWPAVSGAARYHVYRDDLLTLGYDHFGPCRDDLDSDLTDLELIDSQTPDPGQGYFYLVTADDTLRESSLGLATATERTHLNACWPP